MRLAQIQQHQNEADSFVVGSPDGFQGEVVINDSSALLKETPQSEIKHDKQEVDIHEELRILNKLSVASSDGIEIVDQSHDLNRAFQLTNNTADDLKRAELERIFDSQRNRRSEQQVAS